MSQSVVVRRVENSRDFQAFFEFPWTLYRDDPHWVPPLLSMRRDTLDKKKNPAWDYMDGEYFIAWRGGKIVGTISAHINHRHNEFHEENIGWFGMFEVYEDEEAAHALLNTATEWVKAQGCTAIRGPQSFTTHEECGLLIHDFRRPLLLMPYNYPYYQQLIENAGFEKAIDAHSVFYDRSIGAENRMIERMEKVVKRASERSHMTIRPIDLKRKKEEFQLFRDLYNRAWERNWSFVPMTDRELDALIDNLGMFFDSRLAFFAEIDGEVAGFILAIPDFNEVLQKAYARPGEPEIWTMIKAGWYWKVQNIIRGVRLPLMGVVEEHRNKGLEIAMLYTLFKAIEPIQYTYVDAGWILETNQLLSIVEKYGGVPYRTHRFYEKLIGAK